MTRGGIHRPIRLVFVCTANISRSPFMEAYAAHLDLRRAAARGDGVRHLEVASAGVPGHPGRKMDPQMAAELEARGIESRLHVSRSLTAERSHRARILDDHAGAVRKIHVLSRFAEEAARLAPEVPDGGVELVELIGRHRPVAGEGHDISDPYGQSPEAAAQCAWLIATMLDTAFSALVPEDRVENS